jgi:hypothetical protein
VAELYVGESASLPAVATPAKKAKSAAAAEAPVKTARANTGHAPFSLLPLAATDVTAVGPVQKKFIPPSDFLFFYTNFFHPQDLIALGVHIICPASNKKGQCHRTRSKPHYPSSNAYLYCDS